MQSLKPMTLKKEPEQPRKYTQQAFKVEIGLSYKEFLEKKS